MNHDNAPIPVLSMPLPNREQALEHFQEQVQALVAKPKAARGRPTELSWLHLCLGVVACVLMGWQSQLDLHRLLCFEGFWGWPALRTPVVDQAIYNRLERASRWMHALFEQISQHLRQHLEPWQERGLAPFARQVLALDESVLDEMGKWLPELRALCQKDVRLRAGRISALFDVRLQQWWKVDVLQEAQTNCKVHARALIETVQAGTLLLFDRGYFAFEWFDELTQRGIFWISRFSHNASYSIVHVCYQGDGVLDAIIELGVYRSDQTRHRIRLIDFWYHGHRYRYLTNVCDPTILPIADVVRLYARRWDIELAFRLLKDHLHLRLLWSAKWPVIQVQLWAGLLLAQCFHALQQEIAQKAGVKPEEVSLELLVRKTPRWVQQGIDPVQMSVRWGRELGLIRRSSRTNWEVPFVDPSWVQPPPASALEPRKAARHAHRRCEARSQPGGKSQAKSKGKTTSKSKGKALFTMKQGRLIPL